MKKRSKRKQKKQYAENQESILSTDYMLCDYLLFDAIDDEEF